MDTFSLNQARTYILALAQPLARISQAIQVRSLGRAILSQGEKKDRVAILFANFSSQRIPHNLQVKKQLYWRNR
jgi:hypothetical protein